MKKQIIYKQGIYITKIINIYLRKNYINAKTNN